MSQPTGNAVDGYPVVLGDKPIFRIRQGIPGLVSAEERARVVTQRLAEIANSPEVSINAIRVERRGSEAVVEAGDITLFTVRESDGQAAGETPNDLAEQIAQSVKSNLTQYRRDRSVESLLRAILFSVLSTIALLVGLRVILLTTSKLARRIDRARVADQLDFNVQGYQVLGSPVVSYLLARLLRLISFCLIGLCLYLYFPFVLSLFPTTRRFGNRIFQTVGNLLGQLLVNFANYLPNLITLTIIGVIAYFAIGFAKLVIFELGRDDAYSWFYPEWIRPTIRLANLFIVAVACVIAAPYLPGFGSPAFQGISIFLGALFTLGSTAAIANTISGIILVYTRAFRVGDVIQIGEQIGEVLEKSLFVTRILTFQNEVVTIPNSNLLNSEVKNFSSIAYERRDFLRLHTTVTLGYDVPWRKVYDVLIEAAKATEHVLLEPAPFVLQTSLNDYNVAYELNAFTKSPEIMPKIYSQLHENIQDYCNQASIEILSPAFTALREGNHSTIPAEYLPTDYTPPIFQVQSHPPDDN